MKFYYENVLVNQNKTAKTNVAWVADITTLELFRGKKAYVFICIDIHTNIVVASTINKNAISASTIGKSLEKAINKRLSKPRATKLIIHTDRGTQFTSKTYNNFAKKYSEYFIPSMARENTPTDNAVAERFMRTFKEHRIQNITIEEKISNAMAIKLDFSAYRAYFNKYIKSLNKTPNKKSLTGPQKHDNNLSTASMLMRQPKYLKAQSERIGKDLRLPYVENYKVESEKVVGILSEIAARRSELVDKTPFDLDNFEDNLALQIIDQRLTEMYALIKSNPEITQDYVLQAIEPVEDSLEHLHKKVDSLLPKNKVNRDVLPLRDPVDANLFPLFFNNAGSQVKRQKDLKQAQLRIVKIFFI